MKTSTKWIIGGGLAAVVAVGGAGGAALAGSTPFQDDDAPLTGETLDKASAAALDEVGGGEVVDSERDDGRYDIEVRTEDGSLVEVTLDDSFAVLHREADDEDDPDDDQLVTGEELDRVIAAALEETGGGTVTDAEKDRDGTYEVEVRKDDGTEVDLRLDADLDVVASHVDDDRDDLDPFDD